MLYAVTAGTLVAMAAWAETGTTFVVVPQAGVRD
jgi:hypothetical protein